MKIFKYSIGLIITVLIFASCHKRIEDNYLTDENSDRKVGINGGEITFFSNYANDMQGQDSLFYMDIPTGTLDTTYILKLNRNQKNQV